MLFNISHQSLKSSIVTRPVRSLCDLAIKCWIFVLRKSWASCIQMCFVFIYSCALEGWPRSPAFMLMVCCAAVNSQLGSCARPEHYRADGLAPILLTRSPCHLISTSSSPHQWAERKRERRKNWGRERWRAGRGWREDVGFNLRIARRFLSFPRLLKINVALFK